MQRADAGVLEASVCRRLRAYELISSVADDALGTHSATTSRLGIALVGKSLTSSSSDPAGQTSWRRRRNSHEPLSRRGPDAESFLSHLSRRMTLTAIGAGTARQDAATTIGSPMSSVCADTPAEPRRV